MSTRRRKRLGLIAMAVVLGAILTACGGGGSTAKPPKKPTNSTTTTSTTTARGQTVSVYLMRDGLLAVAHRTLATGASPERAALDQLLLGASDTERASGFASAVPTGSRVLAFSISGTTATVDLTAAFASGAGSTSTLGRLAQVTFTLTQFPTITGVVFRLDGKDVSVFGSEGVILNGPQTRRSFDAVLPMILVETPAPGDVVTSPLKVAGLNNTFENNVRIRLRRADGTILADTFATGTGPGIGAWGPFTTSVVFASGSAGDAILEVFDANAENGQPIHLTSIPVRLGA